MFGAFLKLIGALVVGMVVLGVAIGVLGMVFGLAVGVLGLILKLLPFLLIGWIVLKVVQSGNNRHRIPVDRRW